MLPKPMGKSGLVKGWQRWMNRGCDAVPVGGSGPIVKVTGGQVRGATLDKAGAVFKGIPYAATSGGRAPLARAHAGEIVGWCP